MKINANRRLAGLAAVAGLIAVTAIATPATADTVNIVVLGDSLTAGFGLEPGEAFPEQLEAALKTRGHDVVVTNAGVSGDTASGGLARLDWSVPAEADAVIVELGANDALRGIDPAVTEKAIGEIVSNLKGRGQSVLLAGMLAPRNMGDAYAAAFDAIYPRVAEKEGVSLYRFFLEGVAANASLNLDDGMHPNAEGVRVIVENILPAVEDLLESAAQG